MRPRFWESVAPEDMTQEEWEALCDGCGRCCLLKLEDEDTGRVHYTNIACRLFDAGTRRCGSYALRRQLVPGCVQLTPETMDDAIDWMPASCAYRRVFEGHGLAPWHPLISGRRESVAEAGIAVADTLIPEYEVAEEEYEDHVLEADWIDGDRG
ncbi:MAG: YcgN family cysteine cluster protein [Pseudomonadota bacterium]